MTAITDLVRGHALDARVELFCLDLTDFAPGKIFYFCPGTLPDGSKPAWQGQVYEPFAITATGFARSGQGTQATPKLSLSNAAGFFTLLLQEVGDVVGAKVTRWVTYLRYLDGQAEADPNAYVAKDLFFVERVTKYNAYEAEVELSSALDHEGVELPARQVLRTACPWRYRKFTGSGFNYTGTTCPYVGTQYFTKDGVSTTDPALDVCGKRLSDCQSRFGNNVPLPFGGFPGVGRIRNS